MIKTMIPYWQDKKNGFMATLIAAGFVICVVLFALVVTVASRYKKAEIFLRKFTVRVTKIIERRRSHEEST